MSEEVNIWPVASPRGVRLVAEFRHRFGGSDKPEPRSNDHLQESPEHRLVMTAKTGSNGKVLVLRCTCMAEYRGVSRRYYNYDPFAEAASVQEASRLWQEHLAEDQANAS